MSTSGNIGKAVFIAVILAIFFGVFFGVFYIEVLLKRRCDSYQKNTEIRWVPNQKFTLQNFCVIAKLSCSLSEHWHSGIFGRRAPSVGSNNALRAHACRLQCIRVRQARHMQSKGTWFELRGNIQSCNIKTVIGASLPSSVLIPRSICAAVSLLYIHKHIYNLYTICR